MISALGKLGIRSAVPALCQIAAANGSLGPRQRAVIALGLLRDARAIPTLVSIVSTTDEGVATAREGLSITVESITLQEYALESLGQSGGDQRARETVFEALARHPNPRVRAHAAMVVADKKLPGAVDALKLRLDDQGVVKGGVVVRSDILLELSGGAKEEQLPDRCVAEFALDGLASIGSPEALTVLIEVTKKHEAGKEPALLKTAIQGLGRFKEDQAVDRLVGLAQMNGKTVPQEIIVSLGRTGNPKVVDFLTARAANAELDPSERAQAITALGLPAYRLATPALLALLADHTFVRTRPSPFRQLTGPDWETRETICYDAAAALGAIRDSTALAGLQKALDAGQLHKDEASQVQSALSDIKGPEKK